MEAPYFWTEAIRHTFTCSDARARTRARRPATGFEMFVWLNLHISICQNEEVTACDARTCCSATALFFCASTCFSFEFVGFCFGNADVRTACVFASRTFRAFSKNVLFDYCFFFLRVAMRDIQCPVCIPLL